LVALFGSATALGLLGQLLWLVVGSRTLTRAEFGTVLAAQALYGVLQLVVDNGAAFHGARLASSGKLDESSRSSLIRVRLQLAAVGCIVMLAVGAGGGLRFLVANLPYVGALGLWALFNYWEAYGLGDGRPWSAYLILRAWGPPVASVPFLLGGDNSPVYLAGAAEFVSLILLLGLLRLRPLESLRAAAHAARGPWRSVITIGLPSLAWQVGLGSGTIVLALAGRPVAAAALGVGVRLLTGVNQLSAVVVTALFPELARRGEFPFVSQEDASLQRLASIAVSSVVLLSSASLAIDLARPSLFIGAFLRNGGERAEMTATLALSVAGLAGLSLLAAFILVARYQEQTSAVAFGVGTLCTVILTVALALFGVRDPVWMAAALAAGQVASAALVSVWTVRLIPSLRAPIYAGAGVAALLPPIAAVAIGVEHVRPFAAATACLLGLAALYPFLLNMKGSFEAT
jgi:O-antigen/teichoic acid export membrane protein